jgi:protein-disulfide isomerase
MNINNKYLLPLSIVIAGVLVSGTIYFTKSTDSGKKPANVSDIAADAMQPKIEVAPVTSADHVRGNRGAKVKLIVYTDPECPFCKGYYKNVNDLYNSYPNKNDLAIVYRHFPLEQLHPKALKESEALECVAEIGGEESFWKFNDILYAETPGNDRLDPAKLPEFASRINIDVAKFKTCLSSGKYAQKIAESVDAGHRAGGQGTPYSVIQIKNEFVPLVDKNGSSLGMLPVSALKSIVEQLIKS